MFLVTTAFSQTKITGKVLDSEMQGSLPAANVTIKGTTDGTSTDIDGNFSFTTSKTSGEVVITFIGYVSKTITFNGDTNLGTIVLVTDASQLEEVLVIGSGVLDIAKDRKTPVAVSTVRSADIIKKLGNQEFPEILNNTPSVYVTKGSGGFGDSRISIRGFNQNNIAVMVNGAPVNDMENGAVYWSNWAGISDVTTSMQVQRGLGSSKLAIASVGGTVNIATNSSAKKEGGSLSNSVGNDQYLKFLATYSTGKMKNGLSASVLFSRTTGDGYVDGTKFEGHNYYMAFGYEINAKNNIQLTFTGAPQEHNQRSTSPTIRQYLDAGNGTNDPNKRYNRDFGYLNGEEYSFKTNYYHKPVAFLNWDFAINETTKLSTVLYGSWGRGGGSSAVGGINGNNVYAANNSLRTPEGLIDVEKIQAYNSGQTVSLNGTATTRTFTNGQYLNSSSSSGLGSGISKVASVNSHDWYGGVTSLNKKIGNFTFDLGADLRTYKGIHYQNVNDLLGANGFSDNSDVNNPGRVLTYEYAAQPSGNPFVSTSYQQRLGYANDGKVNWAGGFGQVEYATDNLTAFVQGSISNQSFKRIDHFKYLSTDELAETDYKDITGGNVKGGVNYNINDQHNVYVNSGYYSKQPFFNSVYPNNASKVNGNLTNEKITGFEAGYGFRSSYFTANVNVYRTTWKDRYQRLTDAATDNVGGYFDFAGITEIHSGVELEMTGRITDNLKLTGMFSLGDWEYDGNSTSNRYDIFNNSIGGTNSTLYLDKVKVGDGAQTTASITADYQVLKGLNVDAGYRYNDKLYAAISPGNFTSQTNQGSLELPSYGLMDAGVSYNLPLGKEKSQALNFRLNINNVLNELFISESRTNQFTVTEAEFNGNTGNGLINPAGSATAASNFLKGNGTGQYATYQDYQARGIYDGIDVRNQVYFGFGRTWNFTVRYNF